MARKILLTLIVLVGAWFGYDLSGSVQWQDEAATTSVSDLQARHRDKAVVDPGAGQWHRDASLSDDNDGSRHQRFISATCIRRIAAYRSQYRSRAAG